MDVNIESADSVIACLLFVSAWFGLNLAGSLIPRLGHPWELLARCALEINLVKLGWNWFRSLLNFRICVLCLFASGLLLLVHCMLVNVLCMFGKDLSKSLCLCQTFIRQLSTVSIGKLRKDVPRVYHDQVAWPFVHSVHECIVQ